MVWYDGIRRRGMGWLLLGLLPLVAVLGCKEEEESSRGGASDAGAEAAPLDAAPPQDGGEALGRWECPMLEDGCPEGCHKVMARRVDLERRCYWPMREWVACSRTEGGVGAEACYVREPDGLVFLEGSGEPLTEFSGGWRLCTEAERAATYEARDPC